MDGLEMVAVKRLQNGEEKLEKKTETKKIGGHWLPFSLWAAGMRGTQWTG